jgi:hypothetical protein
VIRLGQVSGAANGLWNTKEWFPSLVQAAQIVGSLPGEDDWVSCQIHLNLTSILMVWLLVLQELSWISLPHASKAALEMTSHERPDAEKTGVDVYNLAHPKPVRWNMIMSTISSKLHLPQSTPISYSAWLEKLRELGKADTSGNIGALTLFPFFESVAGNMTEGAKEGAVGVTMALQKAKQASKTLAGDDSVLPPLSEVDVESWIGYWRRAGLLD